MITCIAIDDEPRALEVIKKHAERIDFLQLEVTFTDPFRAITYLNNHKIDLVFLDINMPDIGGFRLLKHLNTPPLVIFTTAHSEYAIESYEVEAVDYLLKPFDFARFSLSVSRAKDRLFKVPSATKAFFFINTGTQKQRIVFKELYYVGGEGNYVKYVTKSGNYLVRASIKETLQVLPTADFVQIHRSYIVALSWIEKIEDNHVFIAKTKISIGATYRDTFLKIIDSL